VPTRRNLEANASRLCWIILESAGKQGGGGEMQQPPTHTPFLLYVDGIRCKLFKDDFVLGS
jgi:hypothetical protein